MANRLNVLVGATLEQNVEKKLNTELAKLNLNALELEAKFDNNFQNIVDNIKKAISAIDFTKINNGLNQVPDVFSQIKNATNGIADGVKIVDKVTRDLNGNLKTTEQRFKAIDNKELNVKVNYDDSGNVNSDKSSFTITDNDGKARLDKQKQVLKLYEKTSEELLKQRDYLKDAHGWTLRSAHVDDAYKPKVLDNFINKTEKLGEKLRKNNLTIEQLLKLENELNKQANAASGYVNHVDFSQSERSKLYKRQLKYNSKEYEDTLTQELRETNQAIADAYADREKIHKQNADREQRAFDEEQKRNQERKQLLQNLYSTYTETEKKTKSLSDTYGNLIDVDNKKFFKQAEANSYAKSLDKIAQKLVDNEHNTEALLEVQKELDDLLSKLDARDKELDSQVKADDKAKLAAYQKNLRANSLANAELNKTAELYDTVRAKVKELKNSYAGTIGDTGQFDAFEKELEEIISDMARYSNSAEVMIKLQERLNRVLNSADASNSFNSSIQSMIASFNAETEREVTRLRSQYGAAFNEAEYRKHRNLEKEIADIIKTQGYNLNACRQAKSKLISQSKDFTTNLKASAKEIKEIEEKAELLNTSLGRFIQFYGFGELFRAAKTAFTDMFEQIKLVDSSMVELKKVTSETEAVYDKFLDNSAEKAKALGVTMTDYIDSVTNFARMDVGGFYAAQEVAEVANIFQQVSENLTADQASEYLISNMKAWGYEASNAIEIVDVLNNLSNKYAITIDGLGESLTRSSAAMMSANNTLEQTAALTIAANNVIQDPLTVGNALKTVSIDILVA